MRAFIAVELSDAVRAAAATLQATLTTHGADVAWVKPDHLHLTLKFLGNVKEIRLPLIRDAVADAVHDAAPFNLTLEGIGAFPGTTNPRVIWVGVRQGADALTRVAQAVERACAGLEVPPEERPFAPHLTIGRVRSRTGLAPLVKMLQVAEFRETVPAPVDHVTLFQSVLSPKGPTYTPLAVMVF